MKLYFIQIFYFTTENREYIYKHKYTIPLSVTCFGPTVNSGRRILHFIDPFTLFFFVTLSSLVADSSTREAALLGIYTAWLYQSVML